MNTSFRGLTDIPNFTTLQCSPWSYTGAESVTSVPSGAVDWVLVQLRTGTASNTAVQTRAAFLMSDGSIHDIDGSDHVNFIGLSSGSYYIVIIHRNHLAVMSHDPVSLPNSTAYDFTASGSAYGTNPEATLSDGNLAMWAGDVDGNGTIIYNNSGNDH